MASIVKSELGDLIKGKRLRHGWTQRELADRVGVTRQMVGMWEQGQHGPSMARAKLLAKRLGGSWRDYHANGHGLL